MPALSDPFTMVFSALWELTLSSPELSTVVRLGNRIRYDEKRQRDPTKKHVGDADLPELVLTCETLTGMLGSTSSGSEVSRRFSWIISTGDMRVGERLLPIEWSLFRALHRWPEVLGSLRWPSTASSTFVKQLTNVNATSGLLNQEHNRGIKGWVSVWTVDVKMYFSRSDLEGSP